MMARAFGFHQRAWENDEDSDGNSSAPEACEESLVVPLKPNTTWLPVYALERDNVDCIEAFDSTAAVSEQEKVGFLQSVCALLSTVRFCGLQQGLDTFCRKNQLAQTIQALLQKQPVTRIHTEVRHLAMDAIGELSSVQAGLEDLGESLIEASCTSVFFLPPKEEFSDLDTYYYVHTLESMDNMLRRLILNSPDPRCGEELQSILC